MPDGIEVPTMFWRRRRLPEEDEPLIPRGMIWQATADDVSEEPPPVMQEDSPNDAARIPPKPVSIPAQASQAPQFRDQTVDFPAYRKPLVGSALPKPVEPARQPVPPRPTLVVTAPVPPVPGTILDEAKSPASDQRDTRLPNAPPVWRTAQAKIAERVAQLRSATANRVSLETTRLSEFRRRSGSAIADTTLKLKNSSKLALLRSQAQVQSVREQVKSIHVDMSGPARAWQRVRDMKVTVRIPSSNLRVIAAFKRDAQALGAQLQKNVQRNEHLWTSMAMAALSALLALGVAEGLRRYDPAYPAAAPETVSASTASKTSASVVPIRATVLSKKRPSPIVAAQVGVEKAAINNPVVTSQKPTAAMPKPKPRIHRSEDDDYVAADTYVRYGRRAR